MSPISRGFTGRRRPVDDPARVPPVQYVTADFPVLSAGPTPHTALDLWDFSILGELDGPCRWTWEEFRALPSEEITRDIHCVTKWSKLDTVWPGVSVAGQAGVRRSVEARCDAIPQRDPVQEGACGLPRICARGCGSPSRRPKCGEARACVSAGVATAMVANTLVTTLTTSL